MATPATAVPRAATPRGVAAAGWAARLAPCVLNFIASMAIMVLELVAGRLVANNVGNSQYSWVSVIGVILAGMSLGYWLGGRLADRHGPARVLWILFALAAALTALTRPLNAAVSAIKGSLITVVVENPAGSGVVWGLCVLLMTALVFLLPATALGAISPVVARMSIDAHSSVGRAIGNVHAWGTLGMILGTFLTGFVLLERFTVSAILAAVALTLAALAAAAVAAGRLGSRGAPGRAPPAPARLDREVPPPGRWRRSLPHAVVFTTSLCLMAIEVVGGRYLSRELGSSIYTWTSIIGVVFAGMSLGNYLGGRLAARFQPEALVGQLALLASILCALVLWSNRTLRVADEPARWPGFAFAVDGRVALEARSLAALGPVGEPIRSKLRPLVGRALSEEGLREAVRGALSPDEMERHGAAILAAAEPVGALARALREDGIPEDVIRGLRPLANRRFADAASFESAVDEALAAAPLRAAYSDGERKGFRKRIVLRARSSALPYPMRVLLVTALVFFAPSIAFGMISPAAARMAIEVGRSAGRAVGNVYASGAWGSIVGTLLCGFFLVRWLGSQGVVVLTALCLALLAVVVARPRAPGVLWLALLVVLALPVYRQAAAPNALAENPEPASPSLVLRLGELLGVRDEWIDENGVETDYQLVRVEATESSTEGGPPDAKTLFLDRLQHGQVQYRMPDPEEEFSWDGAVVDPRELAYGYLSVYASLTARVVGDRFRVVPGTDGKPRIAGPRVKAFFIGAGPYSFQRYLVEVYEGEPYVAAGGETLEEVAARAYGARSSSEQAEIAERLYLFNRKVLGEARPARLPPGARLTLPSLTDTAEIDPLVTEVVHTRMDLRRFEDEPRIKTWSYDARNFVESALAAGWEGRYDLVYGDAFSHHTVPYHLTTDEFNQAIKRLLAPGGAYLINAIDSYESMGFLSAFVATLRRTFAHVYVVCDKDENDRVGQETFVLAASDRPIPVEWLGGLDDGAMEALRTGGLRELAARLERTDPAAYRSLRDRIANDEPGLEERIEVLRLLDDAAVGIGTAEERDAELLRSYIALEPAEVERLVIARGVNAFANRKGAVARFDLDDAVLRRLRREGVPETVLARVAPLVPVRFATVEALLDRLAEVLPAADLARHSAAVVRHARSWDVGPPLLLTDDYAPVEQLLAVLREE